jgi:Sulfotransferase domain
MKVIGAGLPRTATLSQKVALEILGFGPCYHMVNVLADLDEVRKWQAAFDGHPDWPDILNDYESTVDWPGSYFYKELIDFYPDAKVLLSTRDAHTWARSMRDTVWGVWYGDTLIHDMSAARRKVDPAWNGFAELLLPMCEQSGLMPGGSDATAEQMAEAMEGFEEEVKRTVPADRLLTWSVADGWGPLCEFLDVPVPDTPLPHLNDTEEFKNRIVDGSLQVLQAWRAEREPAAVSH